MDDTSTFGADKFALLGSIRRRGILTLPSSSSAEDAKRITASASLDLLSLLDYESWTSYQLTIKYNDNGDDTSSFDCDCAIEVKASLTLNVVNVNDVRIDAIVTNYSSDAPGHPSQEGDAIT